MINKKVMKITTKLANNCLTPNPTTILLSVKRGGRDKTLLLPLPSWADAKPKNFCFGVFLLLKSIFGLKKVMSSYHGSLYFSGCVFELFEFFFLNFYGSREKREQKEGENWRLATGKRREPFIFSFFSL